MLQELGKAESSEGSNNWGVFTEELDVAKPGGMKRIADRLTRRKVQKSLEEEQSQTSALVILRQQHKECERWLSQIPKQGYL